MGAADGPESSAPESDGSESTEPESDGPESSEPESGEPGSDGSESDGSESGEPGSSEPESDGSESTEPESDEPGSDGSVRRDGRGRALAVAAVLLAVVGVGLLAWAATHQTGPPPAPAVTASGAAGPPPPTAAVPGREPDAAEPVGTSSPPVTLRIPAIGVDSPVDQVGLNPDRTMQVPAEGTPGYDHAAWFRYSVAPGRQGPSVIIGHVDSAEEGPSVFYELGRLRPGDRAEVTRADGATVAFEVTEIAAYPKDAFPTERVYGPTPGPELRLITCGGSFDRRAGSYRDNTVVFAREVA